MATLSDLYAHLKTLCEQWFYNKSTMDSYLGDKISKSNTAGLVKNDGSIDTNTYLTSASLTGYEQTTNKTSSWNSTVNNTRYPTEKLVKDSLDLKANSSSLSPVATSGSYNDLSNKPTIPSDVSDLTDTQNTTFTPKSHSHGNLTNDGKLGTTANKPVITGSGGAITTGSFGTTANTFCQGNDSRLSDARTPLSHTHGFILDNGMITEVISSYDKANLPLIEEGGRIKLGAISGDYIKSDSELVNLRVSASTNLNSVLGSIDTAIGNLSSIQAIQIVTTLPTASSSTMGKLYIISENAKVNVYYTEQSGTGSSATYSWHKMDTDILDELSINWSDIQNNPFSSASPSDYATSSHTHGNLSNDGKISTSGTSGGNIVITTSTNAVAVDTIINVIDALVQDLITYGSS